MLFELINSEEHASALCDLINRAYRSTEGQRRWTTEHHLVEGSRVTLSHIKHLIKDDAVSLLAGFIEGRPVCCIAVKHDIDKVEFGNFAVEPELQGRGVGKQLLEYAEQFSRHLGKCFEVSVVTANTRLIEFYIKRGYWANGEIRPYPVEDNVGIPRDPNLTLTVLTKAA